MLAVVLLSFCSHPVVWQNGFELKVLRESWYFFSNKDLRTGNLYFECIQLLQKTEFSSVAISSGSEMSFPCTSNELKARAGESMWMAIA